MKYHIDIQNVSKAKDIPNQFLIQRWVNETLEDKLDSAELTIRIVDEAEITELNLNYRKKSGPTNVLSFPFEKPDGVELDDNLLGDIIICAPVVAKEALQQGKPCEAHWAHLIVHGVLHLLGYDHIEDTDAAIMESLEIQILDKLGHPNPYGEPQIP